MSTLTEQGAERLIADRAFACTPPGFVGAAVDLALDRPVPPGPPVVALRRRPPLRHGFLTARSPRVLVVSGPPSPGLDSCLARMAEDLPMSRALLAGHGLTTHEFTDGGPGSAAIRVGLEAGLEGGGPLGLHRRWALAHTVAPVLAAAFANSPLDRGRPSGWRSLRQAGRRTLPVLPDPADPRAGWTAYVMDAPARGGRSFREWTRSADRPSGADLDRHLAGLRPPVAARGHLELDLADAQPGAGWRVAVAVTATLLDDPRAATEAEAATRHFAYAKGVWERAARAALTDPELAVAARECFLAAYAALARQGAARDLRDAVAGFTERYVLRGRCPADDLLERTRQGV